MILGTPITWFIAEILAVALFVLCILHASSREHARIRILELFGFIVYAAIFENGGVAWHFYDYNLNRIMMIGKVPLEILMIEGAIFYAALQLADYLHIPTWGKPLVVGFLASVQDMTIDPTAVGDRYAFNGVLSGQWNWVPHYDGTFFGIPYYNFTGWVYIMLYYAVAIELGMWLYRRYKRERIGYLYPLAAPAVALLLLFSPIQQFVMFGSPFFSFYTRNVEIVLLVVTYAVGLFVLLRFQKIDRPVDWRRDLPIFLIPITLHLYDIVIAFALNIEIAYVPAVVVSLLHIGYLVYVYNKGKTLKPEPVAASRVTAKA